MRQTRDLVPSNVTELSFDFAKPVTEAALAGFDPELVLVWNRRVQEFEVQRIVARAHHYHVDGLGALAWLEHELVWVTGFEDQEGLIGRDDPMPLLRRLEEGDATRHPEILDDSWAAYQVECQRRKLEERTRSNYRHAFLDNRRLLMRTWAPLLGYATPGGGG